MKIRTRLALIFTLSAALVLAAVSFSVYFMAMSSRENGFFQRLSERVDITEKLFLEKDNLSPEVYQDIREKFLHTLPDEIEIVEALTEFSPHLHDSLAGVMPVDFVDDVKLNGKAQFQSGTHQGVGQVYTHNGTEYAVVVVAEDLFGIAQTRNLRMILIAGFAASILFIFVMARLFARQALRPIALQIQKAQSISASNLDQRLGILNKKDELGQLGLAFNDLLDRLEDAFKMQKTFVRNASHEIRNPLTTIIGEAELVLEKERQPEEYVTALSHIETEANRLNDLVNNFLNLAKTTTLESESALEEVRIDEVLLEAKGEMDRLVPNNQISIDFSSLPMEAEALVVKGNPKLLQAALVNLMDNASKFSNHATVQVMLRSEGGAVRIDIADQGIGIPKAEGDQIFQPLYRSANARGFKGTGIGLSLVQRILEIHNGSIDLQSTPGNGTTVGLRLPLFQ